MFNWAGVIKSPQQRCILVKWCQNVRVTEEV